MQKKEKNFYKVRSVLKNTLTIILLFVVNLVTFAAIPVIGYRGITVVNTDPEMVNIIDDVIFSFMVEQKNIQGIDLRILPEKTNQVDFFCNGKLSFLNQKYTLTLSINNITESQDSIIILTKDYDTYNRIMLESRSLVRELLDKFTTPETNTDKSNTSDTENVKTTPITDINALSGSWKGDGNVEKVVFLRAGRAVAVLTNGASMQLNLSIQDGILVAIQKGPNQPRFFTTLPFSVATKASNSAPPTSWELSLSEDSQTLVGIQHTVSVKHNGTDIISIQDITPKVRWTKE